MCVCVCQRVQPVITQQYVIRAVGRRLRDRPRSQCAKDHPYDVKNIRVLHGIWSYYVILTVLGNI